MKIETLMSLMEDEKYASLTVAEFAKIVKKSGVLEIEVGENDLEFLKEEWLPKNVIHHINKSKS